MNLKYIDIHSHLNLKEFGNDLPEVISRMKEREVGTIVIGVDKESSERAIQIANQNKNVWACVGMHPTDSKDDFDESFFEELIKNPKVVCIGECGLDYFHLKDEGEKEKNPKASKDARAKQKELFKKQIDFAVKHNMPLMLHVREAHEDTLKILKEKKEEYGEKLRGNSHFFTATSEIAKEYFDLGFTISFTGLVTYIHDFDELIKNAPLEMIHIETDSPFVAPVPYKGKRNEPSYVIEVAKKIALIKGLKEGEVVSKLLQNANKLFNLRA